MVHQKQPYGNVGLLFCCGIPERGEAVLLQCRRHGREAELPNSAGDSLADLILETTGGKGVDYKQKELCAENGRVEQQKPVLR